jgi:hypothetical protein
LNVFLDELVVSLFVVTLAYLLGQVIRQFVNILVVLQEFLGFISWNAKGQCNAGELDTGWTLIAVDGSDVIIPHTAAYWKRPAMARGYNDVDDGGKRLMKLWRTSSQLQQTMSLVCSPFQN